MTIKSVNIIVPLKNEEKSIQHLIEKLIPSINKIDKKINKILLRIHYQFLVNFGAILGPIWDHFGRVWGPFWEMLASKFHPRTLPNPFHDQFSLIICAWIECSSILDQFGTNFDQFWTDLGPILDPN